MTFHLLIFTHSLLLIYFSSVNFFRQYMTGRAQSTEPHLLQWHIVQRESGKQRDGSSCGVFVCMVSIIYSLLLIMVTQWVFKSVKTA